jgi:hypothetical protein
MSPTSMKDHNQPRVTNAGQFSHALDADSYRRARARAIGSG